MLGTLLQTSSAPLAILYTALGALAALCVVAGALYGTWHHAKRRYGHPWAYVIGTPANEDTGTPKQIGLIEAVFGDPSRPDSPGLLRDVAAIKAQVSPNGGHSAMLGDVARRIEEKIDRHIAESAASEAAIRRKLDSHARKLRSLAARQP